MEVTGVTNCFCQRVRIFLDIIWCSWNSVTGRIRWISGPDLTRRPPVDDHCCKEFLKTWRLFLCSLLGSFFSTDSTMLSTYVIICDFSTFGVFNYWHKLWHREQECSPKPLRSQCSTCVTYFLALFAINRSTEMFLLVFMFHVYFL